MTPETKKLVNSLRSVQAIAQVGQRDRAAGISLSEGWAAFAKEAELPELGRTMEREAYEDGWYSEE